MLPTTRTMIAILALSLLGFLPPALAQDPPTETVTEEAAQEESGPAEEPSLEDPTPEGPLVEPGEAIEEPDAPGGSIEGVWRRKSVIMTNTGQEMAGIGKSFFILTEGHYASIDERGAQFGTYAVEGDQLIRYRQMNTLSPDPATEPIVRTIRFEDGHLIVLSDHPEVGPLEVRLERVE